MIPLLKERICTDCSITIDISALWAGTRLTNTLWFQNESCLAAMFSARVRPHSDRIVNKNNCEVPNEQ